MALLLFLLALPGCGYTQKELFPEGYQTIAVPMFENRTHYRGVQRDLSEALIKQIEQRTPYKVVSPAVADTVLQGTVMNVEQVQLSRTAQGGVPQEVEVRVTVDFEWRDRDGQILTGRDGFEEIGHYVPTRPVSEPFDSAQHMAAQRLAESIVSALRSGQW